MIFNEFGRVRDITIGPDGYFYVSLSLPGQRVSDTTAGVIVRIDPPVASGFDRPTTKQDPCIFRNN